jgi:hypothetical protein
MPFTKDPKNQEPTGFPQSRADQQRKVAVAGETPRQAKASGISQDPTWSPAPPLGLTPPPAAGRATAPAPVVANALPGPWDDEVTGAAPTPVTKNPFGGANWMDNGAYPLVKPEHAQELEQNAAINEFGMKKPRAEAEAAAYADYKKRQHTEAAAHHLAGMKAAHGAGDMEAARKHSLMYNLHSKALGHEPVGPAHPDVIAHLNAKPSKVYKFKPHHGDQLALAPADAAPKAPGSLQDVVSSAPPPALGKAEREGLYRIWEASQVLLKSIPPTKGQKDHERMKDVTGTKKCPHCGEDVKARGNVLVQHTYRRSLGKLPTSGQEGFVREKCRGSHCDVGEETKKTLDKGEDKKKPEPSKETEGPTALCAEKGCTKRRVCYGGKDSAYCPSHGGYSKTEGGVVAGKKTVTDKFHGAGTQLGPSVQVDKGTHHNKPPHPRTAPAYRKDEMSGVESPELAKVAPPGFSEATMHALKAKHGVESAFKIAWSAYEKGQHKKAELNITKAKKQSHEFLARTKSPVADCKHCGRPRNHPVHNQEPVVEAWETKARRDSEKTNKGEMKPEVSPRLGRVAPCVCDAYKHPHRVGGGKCGKGK